MLLASSGWRPGCCYTSCTTQASPPVKNCPAPNVNSARVGKPSPVVFILPLVGFVRLLTTVLSVGRNDSQCSVAIAFSQMVLSFLAYSVSSLRCRHTSIVVHKDEFFFGSGGISSCPPVSDPPQPCPAVSGSCGFPETRNSAAPLSVLILAQYM